MKKQKILPDARLMLYYVSEIIEKLISHKKFNFYVTKLLIYLLITNYFFKSKGYLQFITKHNRRILKAKIFKFIGFSKKI
jgi:hypothetical protein